MASYRGYALNAWRSARLSLLLYPTGCYVYGSRRSKAEISKRAYSW